MRRHLVLALALAATPVAANAAEVPLSAPAQPTTQQPSQSAVLPYTEQIQVPARAEQNRSATADAALRQPDRIGWWWLVGAIVIGAVIALAIAG
jgi:hypothetical protein